MDIDVDQYIKDIKRLRARAEQYSESDPGGLIAKINLLTDAHMLIGRVSAVRDGEYERIYAARKVAYAKAKRDAPRGQKEYAGDIKTADLRFAEALAKQEKSMWANEFQSIREKIHELRLRSKVDISTFGGGS